MLQIHFLTYLFCFQKQYLKPPIAAIFIISIQKNISKMYAVKTVNYNFSRTCLANHKITQIFTRKYEDVKHKM